MPTLVLWLPRGCCVAGAALPVLVNFRTNRTRNPFAWTGTRRKRAIFREGGPAYRVSLTNAQIDGSRNRYCSDHQGRV